MYPVQHAPARISFPARRPERGLLVPLLAVLLAGCVDFVEPDALGLAQDTRVDVTLRLADRVESGCMRSPPPADTAALCVEARVFPGVDRFGRWRSMLDDTLWAMGRPLSPVVLPDSTRVYEYSTRLPVAALDDTAFTIRFPRVEGVEIEPAGVRWYAVGRADPDSLVREPGEPLRLRLERPAGTPVPPPRTQSWTLDVFGSSLTASYRGSGVPRESYLVPVETLRELGGDRYRVSLRWFQQYFPVVASPGLQVNVIFQEHLGWWVVTRDTAAVPGG